MNILVTGLCTLHWGRLEYGNVGNYYIIEPFFRELHRVFPDAELYTTFQMTDAFVEREKITVLPMELYYSWKDEDVTLARSEYEFAQKYGVACPEEGRTEYIKYLLKMDLVIDVSGDMWGDNAEHVGHERFLVDLYKMRTAQLLKKKTVLAAVTPGPFLDSSTEAFAKEVFANFDLVENREPTSTGNLKKWGFEMSHVKDFACPAFLYQPRLTEKERKQLEQDNPLLFGKRQAAVCGFTFGGFNLPIGPYDMWPREEWQYSVFAEAVEYIINKLEMCVVLFSHTNGFHLPPDFELINGRDYCILEQLYQIVLKRNKIQDKEKLHLINRPYIPAEIKTLIGRMDMLVTGRVHASVAGISQCVPTVFINYEKSFIPSTKMYGFADLAGVGEFVCEPGEKDNLLGTIDACAKSRGKIRTRLQNRIPLVKELAERSFDALKDVMKDR